MSASPLHVVIGPGVLGRAVAEEFVRSGGRVRLVSRSGKAAGVVGAEPFAADVMQTDEARRACAGASVVYQCAAPAYQDWVRDFPMLQESVLNAAAQAGAVLVAAENLYGYGIAGPLSERLPLTATTRKGRIRAAMSQRLFEAHQCGDVRAVAGRAADFFGPGVRMSAFGERVWPNLLAGKTVDWFGNPDVPHSLTYVPDFASALIRLGQDDRAWGRAWHVPSPEARTPRAVLDHAAAIASAPVPRIRVTPKWVLRAIGLFVPAAGETVEMAYSYDAPFVIDDQDYRSTFGAAATDWNTALSATIAAWSGPTAVKAA